MAEKTIPWWRKAFKYALEGIRSGFGLFPRQPKPEFVKESELSNFIEENREVESLTQSSTNPEAVAVEPAKLAEAVSAPEPEVVAIPIPEPPAAFVSAAETEAPEISQDPQPFVYQPAEQLDVLSAPSDPGPETQMTEKPDTKLQDPSSAPELEAITAEQAAEELSPVKGTGFSPYIDSSKSGGALAPEGFSPEETPVSAASEAQGEAPIKEPEDPATPSPAIDPDPESDPESDPEPEAPPANDPEPSAPPVKEPDPDPETAPPPVKASSPSDVLEPDVLLLAEDVQVAAEDEVPIGDAPASEFAAGPVSDILPVPEAEPEIAEVAVVLTAVEESPAVAEIEAAVAVAPSAEPEAQPTLETADERVESVAPPEPDPIIATIANPEPAVEPVAEAEPFLEPEIATGPAFEAAEQEVTPEPGPTPVEPLAQVKTAEEPAAEAEPARTLEPEAEPVLQAVEHKTEPATPETLPVEAPAAPIALPQAEAAESAVEKDPAAPSTRAGEQPTDSPEDAPDLVLTSKPPVKVESRDNAADLSPFSVIVDQVYDGPLDLLLDLIRKQDIDIYDIPIAKITAQFLAYVNQLKATDVDVAGEFIYIASLLIHIKSKMLLPRADTGPDDAAEDPRRELVERLLEHERFKNAAQMLQQKQMLEAATWTNPGVREFKDDAAVEPEIAADTVDLVRVFRDIIERARKRPVFNVDEDAVTVGQMIQFLARRLTMEDKPIALRRLLSHTRSERALIAMFLALLELVRLQAILLRQDLAFSEIFVKKHTGFDSVMNEGLASARDDWR